MKGNLHGLFLSVIQESPLTVNNTKSNHNISLTIFNSSFWRKKYLGLCYLLPHPHSTQFGIKVPEVPTLNIKGVSLTINWFTVERNFTKFVCHWGYQLVLTDRKKNTSIIFQLQFSLMFPSLSLRCMYFYFSTQASFFF